MHRAALLALSLVACTGAEPVEPPELTILAPADGSTVAAGDVDVSLVVDHFILGTSETARAKSTWFDVLNPIPRAEAHGEEGTPAGSVILALDGADVATIEDTVYTLPSVAAGSHTLGARLLHEDGEALEPPVEVSVTFTAE